jgi:hypothetical protein
MKAKLVSVLILYFAYQNCAFSQSQPSEAQHAAKIESLAKEYNSFGRKDWKKRRDFCIQLIDEGGISDVTKVKDVRRIFATDLHYHEATDKLPAGGFVAFERPINQKSNVQNRLGWHFSFESSANGYLWNYWLTDFNK